MDSKKMEIEREGEWMPDFLSQFIPILNNKSPFYEENYPLIGIDFDDKGRRELIDFKDLPLTDDIYQPEPIRASSIALFQIIAENAFNLLEDMQSFSALLYGQIGGDFIKKYAHELILRNFNDLKANLMYIHGKSNDLEVLTNKLLFKWRTVHSRAEVIEKGMNNIAITVLSYVIQTLTYIFGNNGGKYERLFDSLYRELYQMQRSGLADKYISSRDKLFYDGFSIAYHHCKNPEIEILLRYISGVSKGLLTENWTLYKGHFHALKYRVIEILEEVYVNKLN